MITIRPVAYQFPHETRDQYDSNWLIIFGEISRGGHSWTFEDPCLFVREAREVAPWLRGVAAGIVPVSDSGSGLSFVEPTLKFGVVGRTGDLIRLLIDIMARFVAPSPPWTGRLVLTVAATELEQAAAEWESEMAPFPERGLP